MSCDAAAAAARFAKRRQAFGAGNYTMVGVVLQRAVVLTALMVALVGGLWTQMEHLLIALGQAPAISAGEGLGGVSLGCQSSNASWSLLCCCAVHLCSRRPPSHYLQLQWAMSMMCHAGAAHYLHLVLPALACTGMFEAMKRYLMTQVQGSSVRVSTA